MRRASGVIRPAANDQREARECKEEKGRGRYVLQLERVECVCTEILNIYIVQPHTSVVYVEIVKVDNVNNSINQFAKDLCI